MNAELRDSIGVFLVSACVGALIGFAIVQLWP